MRQSATVIFGVGTEGAQTMSRIFAEQLTFIPFAVDLKDQHRNLPALLDDQIRDRVEGTFARQPGQFSQAAFLIAFVPAGFDIADYDRVPARGSDQVVRPAFFAPRRPRRSFPFDVALDSPPCLLIFQSCDEPIHAALQSPWRI